MSIVSGAATAYDAFLTRAQSGRPRRILTALFYAAWTIELIVVIIDKSALTNPYESYIFRVTFLLFLVKMLTVRLDGRERWWLLFFLVLSLMVYYFSGRNELLRAVVLVAAASDLDGKRVMKYTLWFTAAGCLLLVALSLAGVLGAVSITEEYGNGIETRYALGLGHANALHCMAAMLILLALYVYEREMKAWLYFALLVFNLLLYVLTRSNTGFLICGAGILLSALLHYGAGIRRGNGIYILGELVLAAGLVFSAAAAIINPEGHPLLEKIDGLLTGRIASLWDTTFHEGTLSSWKWFADRSDKVYFDMGFVRFVYWYGVIPAVVLIVLLFVWLGKIRQQRDAGAFVLLLLCCLYTVPEAHLVSVYLGRNYCLLLLAVYGRVLFSAGTGQKEGGA